jgi:hypothetical protein
VAVGGWTLSATSAVGMAVWSESAAGAQPRRTRRVIASTYCMMETSNESEDWYGGASRSEIKRMTVSLVTMVIVAVDPDLMRNR